MRRNPLNQLIVSSTTHRIRPRLSLILSATSDDRLDALRTQGFAVPVIREEFVWVTAMPASLARDVWEVGDRPAEQCEKVHVDFIPHSGLVPRPQPPVSGVTRTAEFER